MKRFSLRGAAALALFLTGAPISELGSGVALAQDESPIRFARQRLVDSWDHRSNGDRYVFRSNGKYTFIAGRAKRATGTVSHSGTWRLTDYSRRTEEGVEADVSLRLHSTSRVVSQRGQRRTLKTNRRETIRLTLTEADGVLIVDGQPFYTPDSPERPANLR